MLRELIGFLGTLDPSLSDHNKRLFINKDLTMVAMLYKFKGKVVAKKY